MFAYRPRHVSAPDEDGNNSCGIAGLTFQCRSPTKHRHSFKCDGAAAQVDLVEIGLNAGEAQGRILSLATAERALKDPRTFPRIGSVEPPPRPQHWWPSPSRAAARQLARIIVTPAPRGRAVFQTDC
jgi:hypothetical protein